MLVSEKHRLRSVAARSGFVRTSTSFGALAGSILLGLSSAGAVENGVTVSITRPQNGVAYSTSGEATGTAGGQVGRVTIALAELDDGRVDSWYDWNRGRFNDDQPGPFPINAVGTTNWRKALPSLERGSYKIVATAYTSDGANSVSTSSTFGIGETPRPEVTPDPDQTPRPGEDTLGPRVVVDSPKKDKSYAVTAASGGLVTGRVKDDDDAPTSAITSVRVKLFRYASTGVSQGYFNGTDFSASQAVLLPATLSEPIPDDDGSGEIRPQRWTFQLPTTAQGLVAGRYAVQAVADDAEGNTGTSRPVTFTLVGVSDTTPPEIAVDAPRPGRNYTLAQLSGATAYGRARDRENGSGRGDNQARSDRPRGSGIARVTVQLLRADTDSTSALYFDGQGFTSTTPFNLPTQLTPRGNGEVRWTFRMPTREQGLVAGRYSFSATAVDGAGNATTTRTVTFVASANPS